MKRRHDDCASPDWLALPDVWSIIWSFCGLREALQPVSKRWTACIPADRISALVTQALPRHYGAAIRWPVFEEDAVAKTAKALRAWLMPAGYVVARLIELLKRPHPPLLSLALHRQLQKLTHATLRAHSRDLWVGLPDPSIKTKLCHVFLIHGSVVVPFSIYKRYARHLRRAHITAATRRVDVELLSHSIRDLSYLRPRDAFTPVAFSLCADPNYLLEPADWDSLRGAYTSEGGDALLVRLNNLRSLLVSESEAIEALAVELVALARS